MSTALSTQEKRRAMILLSIGAGLDEIPRLWNFRASSPLLLNMRDRRWRSSYGFATPSGDQFV